MRSRAALAVLLVALIAGAVALQVVRERSYGQPASAEALLYVTDGRVLEKAALGFDALLADVYWIRAIQHYGGTKQSSDPEKKYELLYPLLDITTTLDPRFNIAYRFGAIFLAEPYPGGPGRPDQAIQLLLKGIDAMPEKWRYYQDIGFVYYWWLHNYRAAAEWFEAGSRIEGAPWWMRSLAAVTLTQGGDRARSREMWQRLLESADNEWLRSNAALRLTQLDALDRIDRLQAAVERYRQQAGRLPRSWGELSAAGFLRERPVDPTGTAFQLDPFTGAVRVAPSSKLSPMPVEPAAQPRSPDA